MTDQPKFTPGPWKVYKATNGATIGIGVDRPGDEDHAAGVADPCFGLWGDESEKTANANLIAAAPAMFAASPRAAEMLRIAAQVLRASTDSELSYFYDGAKCDGWCIADDCEAAADGLDTALAKARGQS